MSILKFYTDLKYLSKYPQKNEIRNEQQKEI